MKIKEIFFPDYESIIKDDYPILYKFGEVQGTFLYESIKKDQILNEFITKTISPEITLKQLTSKNTYQDNKIFIQDPSDKDLKVLNSFGWYNSSNKNNIYAFEPKYDYKITPLGYIYHLVPDINLKKVKMFGLTPKTKSKITKHPERVYFMNPASRDEYYETALALFNSVPAETQKLIENYYLLQITPNINSNFYVDPNFNLANGAIWTYQNIPPSHIEILNKILVNPKI